MVTRREFLAGAAAFGGGLPSGAFAQTPKRGGTLVLRAWDPPHFDHSLVHAYKTHVVISFTHSRLLRHRAGAGVQPGSLVLEGDLAESWHQPTDTTYVFKLRKGVRFHAKPPVNGRELTAEDVKFTFERMLAETGSNAAVYRSIAKIEAVDRYTIRFTLSEPFAWFLDMVASPMAGGIVARESVGAINRTDWVQIKDRLRQTRPSLRTAEFPSNVVNDLAMRTDQKPWSDVRVRQAVSLALDRREIIESTLEGVGVINGPLAAALTDWALPIDQLGEGARYYRHDPAEAKRLLAAAGYPKGFAASLCFNSYGSTVLVGTVQLVLKQLKAVGIDARLDQKEYGAYQATCRLGKFDSMVFGPLTPFLEPDNFLFGQYYVGEPRNRSHVKDPRLDDLLVRQRRTMDVKARREVINDIQRHLAKQQYDVHAPVGTYVAVWDGALKNYGPNLGYD